MWFLLHCSSSVIFIRTAPLLCVWSSGVRHTWLETPAEFTKSQGTWAQDGLNRCRLCYFKGLKMICLCSIICGKQTRPLHGIASVIVVSIIICIMYYYYLLPLLIIIIIFPLLIIIIISFLSFFLVVSLRLDCVLLCSIWSALPRWSTTTTNTSSTPQTPHASHLSPG